MLTLSDGWDPDIPMGSAGATECNLLQGAIRVIHNDVATTSPSCFSYPLHCGIQQRNALQHIALGVPWTWSNAKRTEAAAAPIPAMRDGSGHDTALAQPSIGVPHRQSRFPSGTNTSFKARNW